MIYLLYILISLALILLQSLVLAAILPPELVYDLLIPLVVYLSLFHPGSNSLLLILFLGLLMDGITGGAMGIHMLTYFWVFTIIQLVVNFLQKDNAFLMVVAIALGVVLESAFFFASGLLSGKSLSAWTDMTGAVIGRLIAAGVTGPLLLYGLKSFLKPMAAGRG